MHSTMRLRLVAAALLLLSPAKLGTCAGPYEANWGSLDFAGGSMEEPHGRAGNTLVRLTPPSLRTTGMKDQRQAPR